MSQQIIRQPFCPALFGPFSQSTSGKGADLHLFMKVSSRLYLVTLKPTACLCWLALVLLVSIKQSMFPAAACPATLPDLQRRCLWLLSRSCSRVGAERWQEGVGQRAKSAAAEASRPAAKVSKPSVEIKKGRAKGKTSESAEAGAAVSGKAAPARTASTAKAPSISKVCQPASMCISSATQYTGSPVSLCLYRPCTQARA